MASPEWIEIFRSYTQDELFAHVAKLKQNISVFSQQAVGSKSFTRDLNELRSQLAAAVRVQNERSQGSRVNQSVGVTDFRFINGPVDPRRL